MEQEQIPNENANAQNLQPQLQHPTVPVNEIKINSTAMLHELMTRAGFFLPSIKCRFCTLKTLLKIREGELWGLRQDQVTTRLCTRPPSIRVLVKKLHGYLAPHNLQSGISLEKENYPDKPWLIIAVSTTSGGKDEIFGREYVPSAAQMMRNPP